MKENPYIDESIDRTLCNCTQALCMLKRLLQVDDTETLEFDFNERCGVASTLDGVRTALLEVMNELDEQERKNG
ncbi:MAG: hypothetical protein AAGG11_21315 [Pseudomonadota bacterium]